MVELEHVEELPVRYEDLQDIYRVLTTLHNYMLAQDLVTQYRNMANQVQESPITKQLSRYRDRVFGYLQEGLHDELSDQQRMESGEQHSDAESPTFHYDRQDQAEKIT